MNKNLLVVFEDGLFGAQIIYSEKESGKIVSLQIPSDFKNAEIFTKAQELKEKNGASKIIVKAPAYMKRMLSLSASYEQVEITFIGNKGE